MTKQLINLISTIILAVILSYFLPWWSVMVAAFITALFIPLRKVAVFLIPFLAIFLLWTIQTYLLSSANEFVLAKKIAILFPVGGNPYLSIIITGIIGGLAAGIAGILGKQISLMRKS